MTWRERLQAVFESGAPQGRNGLLLAAGAAVLVLLLVAVAIARRRARAGMAVPAQAPPQAVEAADKRSLLEEGIESAKSAAIEKLTVPPSDRILPVGPRGFAALAIAVAVGCWLAGLALAPDTAIFLASPEWRFQPFYIAAHLVTLRAFVAVFTKNFRKGIARLDVAPEKAAASMRLILGPVGAVLALLIAIPFCMLDYQYLFTDRYAKLGANGVVGGIDRLMWGIWCVEWYLNAFIWVVLVGFLFKNCHTIGAYPFRAPIETVLHERHYRPFLAMSAQGASVVLAFSVVTATYIAYTGGELTDYLGLTITGALLVVGFLIPWLLLRAKVKRSVRQETSALGSRIALGAQASGNAAASGAATGRADVDLAALARRLDEVVALLRVSHLERLHLDLGWSEAKAVMIRLLAPAVTIGWHYAQSAPLLLQKLERALQGLLATLTRGVM